AAIAQPDVPAAGESLEHVSLFADLAPADRDAVAGLFTERVFEAGETVTKEGAEAAAFYFIDSATATGTGHGEFPPPPGPGAHLGEIALLDRGTRSATVTADTELICRGITLWDFRPLVLNNPSIAWSLLQTLARKLRTL